MYLLGEHLEELLITDISDYSLWNDTRKIMQQVIQKNVKNCSLHFANIFQPFQAAMSEIEEIEIYNYIENSHQMELPIKFLKI